MNGGAFGWQELLEGLGLALLCLLALLFSTGEDTSFIYIDF